MCQRQVRVQKCDVTLILPRKRVSQPSVHDRPVLPRTHATVRLMHHSRNAYFVNILTHDELPGCNSSEIALDAAPLAKEQGEHRRVLLGRPQKLKHRGLRIRPVSTPTISTHPCPIHIR
eukprot:6208818-Pleurochrysis_carterae.AAC.3